MSPFCALLGVVLLGAAPPPAGIAPDLGRLGAALPAGALQRLRAERGTLAPRDLAPRVSAPLVSAHRRLEEDQDFSAAARLALQAPAPDALAALSRGAALVQAGHWTPAIANLRRAVSGPSATADWARWYLGQALALAGDYKGAAQAFDAISPEFLLAGDAALMKAAALLAAGQAALSRAAVAPILRGLLPGDRAAALGAEARACEALADAACARKAWRAVYVRAPLHPLAAEASAKLGAEIDLTLAEHVSRAEALLDAHQNDRAVREVSRLDLPARLASSDDGASAILAATMQDGVVDRYLCRARLAWGKALRKMRQHTRALAILGPVAQHCDPDVAARAHYIAATNAQILARPDAARMWEVLEERHPGHGLADDALLFAAEVRHREGNLPGERALLERLVRDYPRSEMRSEAMFRIFWSLRADGRAHAGLPWLARMAREYDTPEEGSDAERARYWRARTLLDASSDGATDAVAELASLALERPLGWYGMLARSRLAELEPARLAEIEREVPVAPNPRVLHLGVLADDPHLLAGLALLRAGMRAQAALELLAVDRRPAQGGRDPYALIGVAALLDLCGDRKSAHAIARTELRPFSHGTGASGWDAARVAYPEAFAPLVARHAPSSRLPREFLHALMREESALDPKVLSSAGAVGLVQLMPETAREVARRLKVRLVDAQSDLTDPDLNLRLGAAYLGQLVARFNGNAALAVAAYNAGPGAVDRWLRAGTPGRKLDEFVEEIPLEETRQYVKRVLRSANAYRILYAPKGARLMKLGQSLP